MRILFVMNYPGYLRYFDTAIEELLDRGHEITLAFDRPHKQDEALVGLDTRAPGLRMAPAPPRRGDVYGGIARALRGAADYARYLHPRYAGADYLRDRRRKALELSTVFRALGRLPVLPEPAAVGLVKALLWLERAVPSSREVEAYLGASAPDVVLVSPLVSEASPQTDVLKSARALGVTTGLCVASWDHLTTKGLIRELPDQIFVWNQTQVDEAISLHFIEPERITITGAYPFDRWFAREPSRDRVTFCARAGLPDTRPFVLFCGSTAGISRPDLEERFVRSWIAALRASEQPQVRDLAVLVRPHPYNPGSWPGADLSDVGPATVWPRGGANPVDEADRADYFDTMHHAAAVVGINTSAMIEAAIVGRPVHTIRAPEFADTQGGTLHFHYLVAEAEGFVRVAGDLDEHASQLAESLRDPMCWQPAVERFVTSFVRPHGRDEAGLDRLVAGIEAIRDAPPLQSSTRSLLGTYVLARPLLLVAALVMALRRRPQAAKRVERIGRRVAVWIRETEVADSRRRRDVAETVTSISRVLASHIRGEDRQRGDSAAPDGAIDGPEFAAGPAWADENAGG